MTISADKRRWSYGLFTWGFLAFIISLVGAYSFGNSRHLGARLANLTIAAITPVALGLVIAIVAVAATARLARRQAGPAAANAVRAGLKGLWRAFRSDWPMMIGTLFGLAAIYNLLFLIHWRFW
jgi:hypothetical protein